MKTKKRLTKLLLSKETIANLSKNEMNFIQGGGQLPGEIIVVTDSCNPCAIEGPGQVYTDSCVWLSCGESCH